MATEVEPIEGNWYYDRDKDRRFEVIAVDEEENRIDLQDFDGDLDEISFDLWYSMNLELAEAPEEWLGPMDAVEEDDLNYSDQAYDTDRQQSAMDRYRREQVEWAGKAHRPKGGPKAERRRQPRQPR
ncbi:hypothetical protein CAI21_20175 [Alkalilimnicola ehrlichii]|uniref:Uncharacterized protein n=1 Tax=Alkalilimnicola ehrlichii TaxID=351052 RepID=A0A3E0WJA4_9GAMM|nr:DUF6763 family protein [Alkalilimnicola ehrlichii]RFA24788.1 hypothetical protein CAI21_20175 [Alkalilimnicola ehrlichii]RFA32046.1 hypothetical protein CAL65_20630 [Alkalilimnicola ehrlichii]